MHHLLQFAGRVGAVLAGQPPVLLVDELQLRQPLMDLPLEGLQHVGGASVPQLQGARTPLPGPRPPASSVHPQMKGTIH